jgi:hypothetical protein
MSLMEQKEQAKLYPLMRLSDLILRKLLTCDFSHIAVEETVSGFGCFFFLHIFNRLETLGMMHLDYEIGLI